MTGRRHNPFSWFTFRWGKQQNLTSKEAASNAQRLPSLSWLFHWYFPCVLLNDGLPSNTEGTCKSFLDDYYSQSSVRSHGKGCDRLGKKQCQAFRIQKEKRKKMMESIFSMTLASTVCYSLVISSYPLFKTSCEFRYSVIMSTKVAGYIFSTGY